MKNVKEERAKYIIVCDVETLKHLFKNLNTTVSVVRHNYFTITKYGC